MVIGIIGANGKIGIGLTKFLQDFTLHNIVPISRSCANHRETNGRICDLRNPHQISKALEGIDSVINLSGRTTGTNFDDFYIDNYICSINLYNACLKKNVKHLIQVSSVLSLLQPETFYGKTKALSDRFLLSQSPQKMCITILRSSWVVTSAPDSIMSKFIRLIKILPILLVPHTGRFQPIFERVFFHIVNDCVDKTLMKTNKKIIYCVGSESLNIKEFLKKLSLTMNKSRIFLEFPMGFLINLANVLSVFFPNLEIDVDKFKIQKYDRIYKEQCPEVKKYSKSIKDEMQEFVDNMKNL